MAFEFNSVTHFDRLEEEAGDESVYWGSLPEAVHIIFGTDEDGGNSTHTNVSIWAPSTGMMLEFAQNQFDEEKPQGVVDLDGAGYFRFDFYGDWELASFMDSLEALLDAYKEHRRKVSGRDA